MQKSAARTEINHISDAICKISLRAHPVRQHLRRFTRNLKRKQREHTARQQTNTNGDYSIEQKKLYLSCQASLAIPSL